MTSSPLVHPNLEGMSLEGVSIIYSDFTTEATSPQYTIDPDLHRAHRIMSQVSTFLYPVIFCLGLIGNGLSFLVIRPTGKLGNFVSHVYLQWLAIFSSVFLVIHMIIWLDNISKKISILSSVTGCKLLTFGGSFADMTCIWLIVAICIDRLLLLRFPGLRERWSTRRTATTVTVMVVAASVITCSWTFFLATPQKSGDGTVMCDIDTDYDTAYNMAIYTETVLSMVIPTGLILVANILILLKLQTLKRMNFYSATPLPKSQTLTMIKPNGESCSRVTTYTSQPEEGSVGGKGGGSEGSESAARKKERFVRRVERNMTFSIVLATSLFVLLNLPSYLTRMISFNRIFGNLITSAIANYVAYVLYYLHHGILFFIYTFNSDFMKQELFNICCWCCAFGEEDFSGIDDPADGEDDF